MQGPRQIVCGAPNVTAGIKVIVAILVPAFADNSQDQKGTRFAGWNLSV